MKKHNKRVQELLFLKHTEIIMLFVFTFSNVEAGAAETPGPWEFYISAYILFTACAQNKFCLQDVTA